MLQNTDRISIQVGLSGYSFKIESGDSEMSSGWMTADRIFTTPELQKRCSDVEISVFTPKCTLVPAQFYSPEMARTLLTEVTSVSDDDSVSAVQVPSLSAVLVFSNSIGETLSKVISETVLRVDGTKAVPLPEQYYMLAALAFMPEYNKILASYMDGYLHLVISQGKTLLLCNSFKAVDFTTALYFIFMALKKFQMNPEVSSVAFRTPLTDEQEMLLYRYFKSVDRL